MAKKKKKTAEQKLKEEQVQEKAEEEKLNLILQEHKADQEFQIYRVNEIRFKETQDIQLKKINRHLRRIGRAEFTHDTIKAAAFTVHGKKIKIMKDITEATKEVKFLKKLAEEEPVITADMEGVAPAPKPKEEEEVIE